MSSRQQDRMFSNLIDSTMGKDEKNKYSADELLEFEAIINEKLGKARKELNYIKYLKYIKQLFF